MRCLLLLLPVVLVTVPVVPAGEGRPADCRIAASLPGLEAAAIGRPWRGAPGFAPRRRDPSRFAGSKAPVPLLDGRAVDVEVRTEPEGEGRLVRAVIVTIDHPRTRHGALIDALAARWGPPVRARDRITTKKRRFGLVEATAWVNGPCDVRAILVAWQDTTPRGLELKRIVLRLERASDLAPLFEAIARDL